MDTKQDNIGNRANFAPTKDLGFFAVCGVLLLLLLFGKQWLLAAFVLAMTSFFVHKWIKLVKLLNSDEVCMVTAVCTDVQAAGFGSFTTSKLYEFEDADNGFKSFSLQLANKSFGKGAVKRGFKYSLLFLKDGNESTNANFVDLKRF